MKALWLEDQKLEFRQAVPDPMPGEGEALIRMQLAGICSTDLELVQGYYPYCGIPGHEFVGQVVSSPSEAQWLGKRVVGEINIACGICGTCRSGLPRHCENRRTLGIHAWDGALAEYLVLPVVNLHLVPEHVPDEVAVFTEPLAAAYEILEQTSVRSIDEVLVLGAGRLGQLIALVLNETGCRLDVAVRHPRQRELLSRNHIHAVEAQELDEKSYDMVVEATGSIDGFSLASRFVRPRGRIILKSTFKGNVEANLSQLVVNEVSVIGSRCGPFEPAIRMLADSTLDLHPLVEAVYPLSQAIRAFEHAAQPGILKILIKP